MHAVIEVAVLSHPVAGAATNDVINVMGPDYDDAKTGPTSVVTDAGPVAGLVEPFVGEAKNVP